MIPVVIVIRSCRMVVKWELKTYSKSIAWIEAIHGLIHDVLGANAFPKLEVFGEAVLGNQRRLLLQAPLQVLGVTKFLEEMH